MKISGAFPSQYLKAADLQDRPVRVVIDDVSMEKIGDDAKPVLTFIGKDKGMVLNKTNANNISYAYGDDTDGWHGKEVELFPTMVDFQGRSVEAIRIRIPKQQRMAEPTRAATVATATEANPPPPLDDDVPF